MLMDLNKMECVMIRKIILAKSMFLVMASMIVTGCLYDTASNKVMPGNEPQVSATNPTTSADKAAAPIHAAGGGPLGGYIEQFMDANDKSKLARSLDSSLGKTVSWSNPVSGAKFAVTPISKVENGNNICRSYHITMTKNGIDDKVNGTACIGEDGIWHAAG
jgi:surface antigen